jgi:hypothetical protein
MFTEIVNSKRVLTKEINLSQNINQVLSEYKFRKYTEDLWFLENSKNIFVSIRYLSSGELIFKVANVKSEDLFLYRKEDSEWKDHLSNIYTSDKELIESIMDKVRALWSA